MPHNSSGHTGPSGETACNKTLMLIIGPTHKASSNRATAAMHNTQPHTLLKLHRARHRLPYFCTYPSTSALILDLLCSLRYTAAASAVSGGASGAPGGGRPLSTLSVARFATLLNAYSSSSSSSSKRVKCWKGLQSMYSWWCRALADPQPLGCNDMQ